MKFAIIGAGNVSFHFYKAFVANGHSCSNVFVRNLSSDEWAPEATQLNQETLNKTETELIILAVNDSQISDILKSYTFPPKVTVVHTAGAISIDVFSKTDITAYGVIYPLQTLSKSIQVDFKNIPLLIEANNDSSLQLIHEILNEYHENIKYIDSSSRSKVHLAAVFACNFTNHLFGIAERLLLENDLNKELLLPLLEETIAKFVANGAYKSQTGPALRNDEITMTKHRNILRKNEFKDIYELLSQSIIKLHHPK